MSALQNSSHRPAVAARVSRISSSRALGISNGVSADLAIKPPAIRRWVSAPEQSQAVAPVKVQTKSQATNREGKEPRAENTQTLDGTQVQILVVNASSVMAKEMSLLLTEAIPGCSLTFAPSVELAVWIISRKRINLVVSDPAPPGGGLVRLQLQLSRMQDPPDLVVVGDRSSTAQLESAVSQYQLVARKQVDAEQSLPRIVRRSQAESERIRSLGADLRNDMNNPLQEIVTMLFVARRSGELSAGTTSALSAIEGAAKNLASVVTGLEERIGSAVRRFAE